MITVEELKEITELAESVPEQFRLKCFELLLSHHLSSQEKAPELKVKQKTTEPGASGFVLPIDVKVFIGQHSIDEASLEKLFFIEGGNIRPIYMLKTRKKATAQIQLALLMALENALMNGEFKFSIESLRQRCKEDFKCFDSANFAANLKNNTLLFNSLVDESAVFLSPDGKIQLADVIEKVINE
jgi:hypothetical protein